MKIFLDISTINSDREIDLLEINKELLVEEFVNKSNDFPLFNNKSNSNLESNLNEDKLPWIKKSPWIINKWYGLDFYSAAEIIEIREENRLLIHPVNPPDISIALGKEHDSSDGTQCCSDLEKIWRTYNEKSYA